MRTTEAWHTRPNERGGLVLIGLVAAGLAALIGSATLLTIVGQSGNCNSVMQRLADNQPVSEAEIEECRQAFPNQFNTAVAGGSIVNTIDPVPNVDNAVAQWANGAIGNMVSQGANPNPPTSGNPLPGDVTGQGGGPPQNCSTGIFTCNNGQRICSEVVCNTLPDCSDGSDESPAIDCSTPSNCCTTTNGCPGETAAVCGATCCCCPLGEFCSSDHAAGCVSN
jgi:hypothetical protein